MNLKIGLKYFKKKVWKRKYERYKWMVNVYIVFNVFYKLK